MRTQAVGFIGIDSSVDGCCIKEPLSVCFLSNLGREFAKSLEFDTSISGDTGNQSVEKVRLYHLPVFW